MGEQKLTFGLLSALSAADDPARALEITYVIWERSKSDASRYRNLTVAFAVVWDAYRPDNNLLRSAFAYFDKNASRMRMSVRSLPSETLKYVVNSQRPIGEREWALKRYPGVANVGRLYEQPKYDEEAFFDGKPKKLSGQEYTLKNILKYGGVCHDRAVFATEVAKSLAVPCAYIRGGSSSGYGHAWVGYLKRRGKGYEWDRDSGRIGDEEITGGEIQEPQSGRWVSEHELELAARAMELSEGKRDEARMWLGVGRLLVQAGANNDRAKKAAAEAVRRSIKCGVFDKDQWHVCAELAGAKVLSVADIEEMIREFSSELQDNPPLAVDAFAVLLAGLGKEHTEQKLKQWDWLRGRFPRNDLVTARVQLLKGQYLEILKRSREAEETYADAAVNAMKCRRYGVELLDNATRLMLQGGNLGRAIDLHRRAFARTPRFGDDAYMVFTTRFRVGLRHAKLYQLSRSRRERNKHDRTLRNLLSKYKSGGSERKKALLAHYGAMTYGELNQTSQPVAD